MTNQTDMLFNLLRLAQNLQFQLEGVQSRLDYQSATLSALWTALKSDPEGAALVLKLQKDAHEILQTMNGPPDAGYEQMQAWLGNVQREMLRGTEEIPS